MMAQGHGSLYLYGLLYPHVFCTHLGVLEGAPGSWHCIALALAIVAIWGVNQYVENISLLLSLSFSHLPFFFKDFF